MRNRLFAEVAGRIRVAGFAAALALCGASSLALASATPPPESVAIDQTNVQGMVSPPPPPANFNPLLASDAEIEQYGFPPRPDAQSEPDQYRHWQRLVSVPRVANPKLQQTTIYNGPAQALSAGATLHNGAVSKTSTNWSGYAVSGKNGTFAKNNSAIYAEWIVPIAQQPFGICSGIWNYSSQWIGFDGYNSGDVLQAGTEADAICSGGITESYYSSWIEWYPYSETRVGAPVAEAGDLMGSEVWFTTASPYGHAYLANYTLNQADTYTFNPPPGTTYVGESAEWIEERPGLGGGVLADLTNYVADPFNDNYATNGKSKFYPSKSAGGTKRIAIRMVCPPWSTSACTSTTVISTPYLSGLDTIWFSDSGPAYGSGL